MKSLFLSACILCAPPAFAQAPAVSTQLMVSYSSGNLIWSWVPGIAPLDGVPDGFTVKCAVGTAGTVPTIMKNIADPTARKIPINQVVSTQGQYNCTVVAYNVFGGSADSNRVSFQTGDVPAAPTGFGFDVVQP